MSVDKTSAAGNYPNRLRTLHRMALQVGSVACLLLLTASIAAAQTPGTIKWQFNAGAGLHVTSPAIGPDGTIYFTVLIQESTVQWYRLFALNPDGSEKWRHDLGLGSLQSPAVGNDGTIYAPDSDGFSALNPDGSVRWRWDNPGGSGYYLGRDPAIGADGTIYMGDHAINPDGTTKWVTPTWHTGGPVIAADGTLYYTKSAQFLEAVNPDGNLGWRFEAPLAVTTRPAIGLDGTIYVGGEGTLAEPPAELIAIHPDGTLRWEAEVASGWGARAFSPAIGLDGTIYAGTSSCDFYALNPDGTEKWLFPPWHDCELRATPAIGKDGSIVFTSLNHLYSLNPDGTVKWNLPLMGNHYSSPAIDADGTVYVGSSGSPVLTAVYDDSGGLAFSPWPMLQQNVRHTGRAETPIIPLTLGETFAALILPRGVGYFTLDAAAGDSLLIEVVPGEGIDSLVLSGQAVSGSYLAEDPTPRGSYELLIYPSAEATYFFTVFGDQVDAAGGDYTITASSVAQHLSDFTPRSAGNAGEVRLLVRGLGFANGMQVELSGPGPLTPEEIAASSSTELLARFDLQGATPGNYGVTVTWPDASSDSFPAAFAVVPGIGPHLEAELVAPEFIRPDRKYVLWLEYANTGDADMPAPLFTMRSNALISLDPDRIESQRVEILGVGDTADAHVLMAGESRRVPIYFIGTDLGTAAEFSLWITDGDDLVIDWVSQKDLMKPAGMDPAQWDALWPDLIARLGDTWGEYKAVLRTDAQTLAGHGGPAHDVSQLVRLEMLLAGGNPVGMISGLLRHADSLEPLVGVTIRARSPDGLIIRETETASDPPGHFTLQDLPDGDYDILVEGYTFTPPESLTLADSSANGLELYAHDLEPGLEEEPPDIDLPALSPSLTADDLGNLYAIWQVGGELLWAVNSGSGWELSGKIPGATGTRPVVVWDPGLLDGALSPGLFVAWEAGHSPRTILWSVGEFTGDDLVWTAPQSLTSDPFADSGIAAVVDAAHIPVVLWLQRDLVLVDDTDLYYSSVDLAGAGLVSESPMSDTASQASLQQCGAIQLGKFSSLPKFIPVIGGKYGWGLSGQVCDEWNNCDFKKTGQLQAAVELGDFLKLGGSIGCEAKWRTENAPASDCRMVFVEASAGITVQGEGETPHLFIPIPAIGGKVEIFAVLQGQAAGSLTWETNFPGAIDKASLTCTLSLIPTIQITALGGAVTGSGGGGGEVVVGFFMPAKDASECVFIHGNFCFEKYCSVVTASFEILGGAFKQTWTKKWCNPEDTPIPITEELLSGDTGEWTVRIRGLAGEGDNEVPIFEEVIYEKVAFLGTGASYEGVPILGDISSDLYNDGLPAVAKSGSGEILVVWTKDQPAASLGAHVHATVFSAAVWEAPVSLTGDVDFNKDPTVVFDSNGIPMVIWSQASNAGLDYAEDAATLIPKVLAASEIADIVYSRRVGDTWSAPATLATLTGRDEQTALAAGPGGELVAAWLNESESGWTLYAAFRNGSAWTAPAAVTTAVMAERPAVAYGSSGSTILWAQDTDGDVDTFDDWKIYGSTWDGSAWSAPQPLPEAPIPPGTQQRGHSSALAGIWPSPPQYCCGGGPVSPPSTPPGAQRNLGGAGSASIAGVDPNEKTGTPGQGAEHYVPAGDRLSYTVYFENLSSASAPAQEVFVTDCLAQELDWTTLRLDEVAFGDVIVANSGASFLFQERVTIPDYRPAETKQWWVDIEPEFDFVTGCLTVRFRTLDPDTEDLPTDPFAGFLPPEDGTGRGQGHIGISIDTLADLADGTQIENQASIVFDTNQAIWTNEFTNTIGTSQGSWTLTVSLSGIGGGTVTSNPAGIDCGSDCSEVYGHGTAVTLSAQADTESVFVAWLGDSDCADGEVTMDFNLNCVARFEPMDIFGDGFEAGDTSAWSSSQ